MQRPKPDPVAHGFYADILHFLRKRMDNASDAADMTQDVFAQWLGYRDRAKVEQPRAFLFQVARNLLSDHWRRQKVRHAALADDTLPEQQSAPANDPWTMPNSNNGWINCVRCSQNSRRDAAKPLCCTVSKA